MTKFTICIIIRLVEVVRLKEILYTYTVKSIDDASYNGEPLQNILFVRVHDVKENMQTIIDETHKKI